MFKLTPAQFGLGGLATLGAAGAGFFLSKEKKKAQNKVETFKSQDIKDWDKFTENTARKSFVQELGKDPMTDPKLLMYADNMNRLKTGSKVQDISGDGGKSYQITKLRGSNRLGCTCNDWRYKRSVAQPGEEQDCKHIKQYRQMSKTAASTYEEEGSFTHDGKRYSLQEAFRSARTQPTKQIPVDDLKWVLAYDRPDPARLAAADLTAPVLVAPDQQGRPTVVDGLHRLSKAVREGRKTIPAKVLPLEALKTAAASFKDTLPKPVIDGKPHSGTWTIVGSGRLSIPKKTSDIDYMVPLEEVKDLSSFQEYKDVPGVYWRDSETVDGRPSTIVAVPRYAYDKIDASYQQATDRFGKLKLRQLKKKLPKDSFYKDIGVIYTSDAMKKGGGHVEDRIAERAPGAEAEVNTLRAKLDQIKLRKGQTYHVPLSRGKGYVVIGDVGDKHAVKTVLGPSMRPPGERLKLARAPRDYKREYAQYHAKPDQVENRSLRNQARRKLGLKKGDPREADHKTPLSKGGGNGHGNLRAVSRKTNRIKFTDPS